MCFCQMMFTGSIYVFDIKAGKVSYNSVEKNAYLSSK